jgi:hypothetical protein
MAQFKLVPNLTIRASDGKEWSTSNVVTSGGLSLVRDYLASVKAADAPTPPTYIELGSGVAPVGRFMTAVTGGTHRTPIVQREKIGQSVVFHWFLADADNADQTIGTYGLIAGEASQELGTGTLVAIALDPSPFLKDPTLSYSGEWRITMSGVI